MSNTIKKIICKPFDYSLFNSTMYDKEHTVSFYNYPGKTPASYEPIRVMLAFTPGIAISRPPVFISRGRRIAEIREIKSFSSDRKRDIWSHPQITGFIDLKTLLDPTIARTDYRNNDTARRIFGYIKKTLEPELLEFIENNIKIHSKNDFSELEQRINELFRNFPDSIKSETNFLKKGDTVELSDLNDTMYNVLKPDNNFTPKTSKKWNGTGKPKNDKISQSAIEPPSNNTALKVKIDADSEPILDSKGKPKRSELYDHTVIIYKKHPEFDERIDNSSLGDKITYNLITYITGETLVHYTHKHYNENVDEKRKSKEAYIFLTSRLYSLEKALKDLVGKSLSSFAS